MPESYLPPTSQIADYLTPDRMISIQNQVRLIESRGEAARDILEIGVYQSLLPSLLPLKGYRVTTADYDPAYNPDLLLDLRGNFSIPTNQFDLIVLFQVLEHLPFNLFPSILKKIGTAARHEVIISLPYRCIYTAVHFRTHRHSKPKSLLLQIPKFWSNRIFTPDHHWEVGLKGYSRSRVEASIHEAGLAVMKRFQDPLNPYHLFYVLKP